MFLSTYTSALLFAAPALATIYTTYPVSTTHAYGGQVLEIKWEDNGETPTLPEIGPCLIDLCIGSENDQRCVQNLGESVDVSKAFTISTTIDPSVGENGKYYFIRYRSHNLVDPTSAPQGQEGTWPYQQYSARFFLNDMTGNFDDSEKTLASQSTGDMGGSGAQTSTGAGASASGSSSGSDAGTTSDAASSGSASGSGSSAASGASALAPAVASSVSVAPSSTQTLAVAASRTSASAAASSTVNSGVAHLAAPGLFAVAACIAAYIAI